MRKYRHDGKNVILTPSSTALLQERIEQLEWILTKHKDGSLEQILIERWNLEEDDDLHYRATARHRYRRQEHEALRVWNWAINCGQILTKPDSEDPNHWLSIVEDLPMTLY